MNSFNVERAFSSALRHAGKPANDLTNEELLDVIKQAVVTSLDAAQKDQINDLNSKLRSGGF